MSEKELKDILKNKTTHFLRCSRAGGPAPTYFTDARMRNQFKTANRLGLEDEPQYRVEFLIEGRPKIEGGTRVEPAEYMGGVKRLGMGREYWSFDPIEVEIINTGVCS